MGHGRNFVATNRIVFAVRNDVCVHSFSLYWFSVMVVKKIRLCGLVHILSECLCPSKLLTCII